LSRTWHEMTTTNTVERVNVGGDPNDASHRHWREKIAIHYQSRNGIQSVLTNFIAVTNGICAASRWFGPEWKRATAAALIKSLQKVLGCKFTERNGLWVIQTELKVADVEKGIQAFVKKRILCPKCAQPEWNGSTSCKGCGHHVATVDKTSSTNKVRKGSKGSSKRTTESKRAAGAGNNTTSDDEEAEVEESKSSQAGDDDVALMHHLYDLRTQFVQWSKTTNDEYLRQQWDAGDFKHDARLEQKRDFARQVVDRAGFLLDKCWHLPPPSSDAYASGLDKMKGRATLLIEAADVEARKWRMTASSGHEDGEATCIALTENSTDADKRAEVRLFLEWKNRHLPEAAHVQVPSASDIRQLDSVYSQVCGTASYAQFLQSRSVLAELKSS
jgi:uncharacterized Zn finger protein (UPF0148 family)